MSVTTDLKYPAEFGSVRLSARSTKSLVSLDDEKPAAASASGWRFHAAFSCLCVVNLVSALDASSLSVALPTIAEELHGSGVEAFWSGTSFLLASTVFQPSFASFSEVFGRKPMLLIALALFTAGAIIAAVAQDFAVLLIGRTVQGIGGGGIQALSNVIITDLAPLKERGKYVGIIAMTWAVGSVAGPVIGGVLVEKSSWRWIFWLNIPFCAVAFIMIPIFLNLAHKGGNLGDKLRKIDWVGSFLFVASTTSVLIPITWGGTMYAWTHWRTLTPLCVGVLGLVLFLLWSSYVASHPILPGSLFASRTSLVTYLSFVIHGMVQWGILFYMPLYFEGAKNLSPIGAGVALFPWTFTVAPAAVIVGFLIARMGRYRWALWSGWVCVCAGMGLLIIYEADTPTKIWVPLALVSGLGLGILYPSQSLCNQAAAPAAEVGIASALSAFFRNYGQMLGVAVGGTVVQNAMRDKLEDSGNAYLVAHAGSISKDVSALVETIKAMRESTDAVQIALRDELVTAYCGSLRTLWIFMTALAGVALVCSVVFTKAYSLDRDLETTQGFVAQEKAVELDDLA
ncbi:mfs multidrug transporter [Diplodia corticola]|uniref:Mfs multidrug transporter n=1 Tax=Diplodia corticola TaxID=236234 RepID=A0A1J9RKJ4_9PEZI|nr:mfs multidrug transporter [Diplodia corticola]OJD33107.1 mfs multidrug transporter [Diplodia corticola]